MALRETETKLMAEVKIQTGYGTLYPDHKAEFLEEIAKFRALIDAYPQVEGVSDWKSGNVATLLTALFGYDPDNVHPIEQSLADQEFLDRDNLEDETAMATMELPEIEGVVKASQASAKDKRVFLISMRYIMNMLADISMNG